MMRGSTSAGPPWTPRSFLAGAAGQAWAKCGQPRQHDRRKAAHRAHVNTAVTTYRAAPRHFATGTTGVKRAYSQERSAGSRQLGLKPRGTHTFQLHAQVAPTPPTLVLTLQLPSHVDTNCRHVARRKEKHRDSPLATRIEREG